MKKYTKIENTLNEGGMMGSGGMISAPGVGSANNPGYTYAILPFNHSLEQKCNEPCEDYYVHVGSKVCGKGFNDPESKYTGNVIRIIKDFNGEIVGLYIMTDKTKKMVTISPDDLTLLILKDEETRPIFKIHPQYNISNLH